MTDKQQRARELMVAAYGAVSNGTMHDLETEVLLQGAGPAIELLAAALLDEQPAQGEVKAKIKQALVPYMTAADRAHGDDDEAADAILRLLAPPAGPAVEELLAAADYLIDQYRTLWKGGRVRDLEEGQTAYLSLRNKFTESQNG